MLKEQMKHDEKLKEKQWEHAFRHANLWHSTAQTLGLGFLMYLPVDKLWFANTW